MLGNSNRIEPNRDFPGSFRSLSTELLDLRDLFEFLGSYQRHDSASEATLNTMYSHGILKNS